MSTTSLIKVFTIGNKTIGTYENMRRFTFNYDASHSNVSYGLKYTDYVLRLVKAIKPIRPEASNKVMGGSGTELILDNVIDAK